MGNWIFSTPSTNIVFVGIASFFLLCGPTTDAAVQEVRPALDRLKYIHVTDHSVVIDEALERSIRFQKLITEWRQQRGSMSWVTEMATCRAYQSIIGMGPLAIPLILAQLESEGDEPDHWSWALRALTGVNPVTAADRGDIVKIAHAWIDWGKNSGYAG